MEKSSNPGIRLPELVQYLDRLLGSKEKRSILDIIVTLEKEYEQEQQEQVKNRPKVATKDLNETLGKKSLPPEELQTILNGCERQSVENSSRDKEKRKVIKNKKSKPRAAKRVGSFLPAIKNSSPVRPTELLCRILSQHNTMGPDIVIPRMTMSKDNDCDGESRATSPRKHASNRRNHQDFAARLPHFNYEHGDGPRRNLPGQPELIRLLTEPEMHLGGADASKSGAGEQNTWMSLFGGTMSPPLIDKRQQKRTKRRKMLCKYCRRSPGDHHKWCVYYTDVREFKEPQLKLVGSFTDDDIDLNRNVDKNSDSDFKRSKTTLDESSIRRDLPDYSSLHRDVYVRALADSHTRLIMKNAHDFTGQTTKPFVFSYFQKGNRFNRFKVDNEMQHIFGEDQTDFTDYYKVLSNTGTDL